MVSPLAVVAFCLVSYTLSNVGQPVSHYHNHSCPGSSSSNACMTMDHFAYQPPSRTSLGFHSHYPPTAAALAATTQSPHLFPPLQELSFHFYSYIGSIISSIPSDSVTLIQWSVGCLDPEYSPEVLLTPPWIEDPGPGRLPTCVSRDTGVQRWRSLLLHDETRGGIRISCDLRTRPLPLHVGHRTLSS